MVASSGRGQAAGGREKGVNGGQQRSAPDKQKTRSEALFANYRRVGKAPPTEPRLQAGSPSPPTVTPTAVDGGDNRANDHAEGNAQGAADLGCCEEQADQNGKHGIGGKLAGSSTPRLPRRGKVTHRLGALGH